MAARLAELLGQSADPGALRRWCGATALGERPGPPPGAVGRLGYPPFYAVCGVLAAVQAAFVGEVCRAELALPRDLLALVAAGAALVHIALFDPAEERFAPWPVRGGAPHARVTVGRTLLEGRKEADSQQMLGGQLFLEVPPGALQERVRLEVARAHRPSDVDPQEWCQLGTLCALLVRRVPDAELLAVHAAGLPSAPLLRGDEDDDVEIVADISLRCGFTQGHMQPPFVRGLRCAHPSCFSLVSWLQMMTQRGFKSECIFCRAPLDWEDLCRDRVLEEFAARHPELGSFAVQPSKWGTAGYEPEQEHRHVWTSDEGDSESEEEHSPAPPPRRPGKQPGRRASKPGSAPSSVAPKRGRSREQRGAKPGPRRRRPGSSAAAPAARSAAASAADCSPPARGAARAPAAHSAGAADPLPAGTASAREAAAAVLDSPESCAAVAQALRTQLLRALLAAPGTADASRWELLQRAAGDLAAGAAGPEPPDAAESSGLVEALQLLQRHAAQPAAGAAAALLARWGCAERPQEPAEVVHWRGALWAREAEGGEGLVAMQRHPLFEALWRRCEGDLVEPGEGDAEPVAVLGAWGDDSAAGPCFRQQTAAPAAPGLGAQLQD
eukprot:TRINITY_DN60026_c0_g1_i1.p1 TRINITY_DN60026_c0_g1~~TRINITY_DN60026_c0_g1_i1.p1  ORF type:complete len:632 (+),score=207.28 TRINITY_DN60026_c0_g1_i1:61-1896(+)